MIDQGDQETAPARIAKIVAEIQQRARELREDAAEWRQTATKASFPAAHDLVEDAEAYEWRAARCERWATALLDQFALLQQTIAAQGWRPIETAPENESILIYLPNREHYGPGIYRAIHVNMGTGRHWLTTGCSVGRDLSESEQPTHWMALPSPPLSVPEAPK
jgi:hypothetical protein